MSQELLQKIKSLPGYKISRSHFRLGSKIHISDFYYAKRIFQNHFFASRFAFMLSKEISKTLQADYDLSDVRRKGITLIGYGLYSELLISLVEKFLKQSKDIDIPDVQHNLINDSEELKPIKQNPTKGYTILIVPIASTFSTSLKIEESLKSPKVQFVEPHFNLIHISGGVPGGKFSRIEKEFGWKERIGDKIISLTPFFEEDPNARRKQRYFLSLPTVWQKVDKCENCFPVTAKGEEALDKEEPLFDTDRTSVTPTIVFDFPQGRKLDPPSKEFAPEILPEMVRYGHHKRNHAHFIYSINTELFLSKNADKVGRWLDALRKKESFRKDFLDGDHVLIISSCHFSNATLLNLVNEKLFFSAANILHYDPDQDYVQNFDLIYGFEVRRADKIIFVDDSLKSGKTFSKINDFVNFTLSKPADANYGLAGRAKGIDCCIFLLNKAQPLTMHMVLEKLKLNKHVFAFTDLHLFTSLSYDDHIAVMAEENRYRLLINDSFLDSLKLHFHTQLDKLKIKAFAPTLSPVKQVRHLLMLDATHRLQQFFASITPDAFVDISFHDFVIRLYKESSSPIEEKYGTASESLRFTERQSAVLKVLTQLPFTQFEPLRRLAFQWVIRLMLDQLDIITRIITAEETLEYGHFLDFKFLVRRAGLLNSNVLISVRFLQTLKLLYSGNGLPKLQKELAVPYLDIHHLPKKKETPQQQLVSVNEHRIKNLQEFHVFYESQVKELLLLNEARSIKLEKRVRCLGPGPKRYNQILRILRVENSVIIQRFYEFLTQQDKWKELYPTNAKSINESTAPLVELIHSNTVSKHHRYTSLKKFFIVTGQKRAFESQTFHDYLWLRYFLATEQHTKLTLTKKTNQIFRKLKLILRYSDETNNITSIGAFMIIKGGKDSYFMAYDKNEEDRRELDPNNWKNNGDRVLTDFLEGMMDASKTYYKSILELRRNDETSLWEDLYAVTEDSEPVKLRSDFLQPPINRIILLRLSRRVDKDSDVSQGVIAFYFHSKTNAGIETNCVQYLVLLRQALGDFVERHHQTSEFRDWFFADNAKRLAFLSGHGRFMIQRFAAAYPLYTDIALNLEHLQMIILLEDSVKSQTGYDNLKQVFNKFYNVEGQKLIKKTDYLAWLKKMATTIYDAKEVETKVPVPSPVITDQSPEFSFAFNKNILDLICFELLVNAKKNRWHPLDDDPPECVNRLSISIELIKGENKKKQLKLTMKNTGPTIDPDDLTLLQHRVKNVKNEDITSGTALIKKLVRTILGGDCIFSTTPPYSEEIRFSEFTVEVYLNEMNKTYGYDSAGRKSRKTV